MIKLQVIKVEELDVCGSLVCQIRSQLNLYIGVHSERSSYLMWAVHLSTLIAV